ncbi:MAG: hypothetical protein PUG60_10415 [Lachnospiraceae bacterium]|nr:hypothetical protein [Lachnospiraceae bacterium]
MSREENDLLIGGGKFLIRTNMKYMTRKEKAVLIELVGNFPDNHETFRANKGGEQQELRMPEFWNIDSRFENADRNYKPTYVLVSTITALVRAVQNTENNSVLFFDDFLMGAIQVEGTYPAETTPDGPRISENMVLWKNDICTYAILKFDLKNEQFSRLLENMELYT